MSRRRQVTGRTPSFGNRVSHPCRCSRRRFTTNIRTKRHWLPSGDRYVRPTAPAQGIKVIDERGIEAVVAEIRARGERV